MTRTQGAITAKAALQLQGVLAHRTMRLPLVAATDAEVEALAADLAERAAVTERVSPAAGTAPAERTEGAR